MPPGKDIDPGMYGGRAGRGRSKSDAEHGGSAAKRDTAGAERTASAEQSTSADYIARTERATTAGRTERAGSRRRYAYAFGK